MPCRWIYVRMALSLIAALSLEVGILWFYFRRVRPFMRKLQRRMLAAPSSDGTTT